MRPEPRRLVKTGVCRVPPPFPPVLLASSSPYRRQLLAQLLPDFEWWPPGIDETPRPGETPIDYASRMAEEKNAAAMGLRTGHLVIASDQCGDAAGAILGKPVSERACVEQLMALAGRTVGFHTAVAVSFQDRTVAEMVTTEVRFRRFRRAQAEAYAALERPFDCAGGFKCEARGIALFDAITADDPTALVGLPLCATNRLMLELGFDCLDGLREKPRVRQFGGGVSESGTNRPGC